MISFLLKRPVLSIVFSIMITLAGFICLKKLPVERFPNFSPPQVTIRAIYPGADAEAIAASVTNIIEAAIANVDNLVYTVSTSKSPGQMSLTAYFSPGADRNKALYDIQGKVNAVTSRLPEIVRKTGISIDSFSPDLLLIIGIQDTKGYYDATFLTNYASVHMVPKLQSIPSVNTASVMNATDYSMRIWLQPDRLAQFRLSPTDVRNAILEQNATYSVGQLGQEPSSPQTKLTIPVTTPGQLTDAKEFEEIIIRANTDGSMIYLKDIANIELGSQSYDTSATLNGKIGTLISVTKMPNANALQTATEIHAKLQELSRFFPPGIAYSTPYDTTSFIKNSVLEVIRTLVEAVLLVSLVILCFLQSFRAAFIPIITMIVSIIGTATGLYFLGYSINTLTLFGTVLAIGIVVDDAIVVVEGVDHKMKQLNLPVQEAVLQTMHEVSGPIVAICFALAAVFFPVAFMSGIVGQLYKQFAVTIVISVVISGFVAITLTPVLTAKLLHTVKKPNRFAVRFNDFFRKLTNKYLYIVDWTLHNKLWAGACCLALFCSIPALVLMQQAGFMPDEDQGALIIVAELPDGANLARTQEVSAQIEQIAISQPGVQDVVTISGGNGVNSGLCYVRLSDWSLRKAPSLQATQILKTLNAKLSQIPEAVIYVANPPSIPGISAMGLLELWVLNQGAASPEQLKEVVDEIIAKGKKTGDYFFLGTNFSTDSLGLHLTVDRLKAKTFGVQLDQLFYTLQMLMGSIYINDFLQFGKSYRVIAQADPSFRNSADSIGNLFIPSSNGEMIPLKSFVTTKFGHVQSRITHFNAAPAARITAGSLASPTTAIETLEHIADKALLPGMSFQWSGLALEAKAIQGSVIFALLGGLIMLFFILAALYERWILPLCVFFAIPFGVVGALIAVWVRGLPMDLYFQIGLIASIGISAKNGILIIEYAKLKKTAGSSVLDAAKEAAALRFRAIVMTSLTIILAMLPLAMSSGAGAASKHSVGTGILGGIFFATLLSLIFLPFFFSIIEREKS